MSNALFIAWRSGGPNAGKWAPVGRVDLVNNEYRFVYTKGAEMLPDFRPFPGMPNFNSVYVSSELFPLLSNRMLARSRPEYESFLTWGGFDPNVHPEPLALLGVTEGLRQTDAVEMFPCPEPDEEGCYLSKFFLHGVRWMPPEAQERIALLKSDEQLGLMPDISNPHDRDAVAVRTFDPKGRFIIGYVPRYLAKDVRELCVSCDPDFVTLHVERLNIDAPLQQRVLCRMNACWPQGFQPCNSEAFEPIVELPLPNPGGASG